MESAKALELVAGISDENKIQWSPTGSELQRTLAMLADGGIILCAKCTKESYQNYAWYFENLAAFLEKTSAQQRQAEADHSSGISFCDMVVDLIPGEQVVVETLVPTRINYPRESKLLLWAEKDDFYTCSLVGFRYKKVSPGLWLAGVVGGDYSYHGGAELLARLEKRFVAHERALSNLEPQFKNMMQVVAQAVRPLEAFRQSVLYLAAEY